MTAAGYPWLVADIGGTNCRFGLVREADAPAVDVLAYRCADYPSPEAAAAVYLGAIGERDGTTVAPQRIAFAVATAVEGDTAQMTNSAWLVSRPRLAAALGARQVLLLNDFEALALALPRLGDDAVEWIGTARPDARLPMAVIGPGTGLGVGAFLIRDGVPCVLETEGGHVSFAARSDEEWQVLQQLKRRFGRVSNERLLCGSGLVNIYQALSAIAGVAAPSDVTPERVTVLATAGDDTVAVRAVELFCEVFGAAAGDLVLAFGAWDGVYLTGGLLPAMLPFMRRGGFRRHFEDKGRFDDVMPQVPTVAIRHPEAGLLGAAGMARLIAGKTLSAAR